MMKSILILISSLFLFTACSSSKLVSEWKSPDAVNFEANKVLVIGLTQDLNLRRQFEGLLTAQLERKNVIAMRSSDFFEESFTNERRTESELSEIEQQLLDAGFDAILFTKVVGTEDKVTLTRALRNFEGNFSSFRDDYYRSQEIFSNNNNYSSYKLHHAQTNLYCICPDKPRELLWSGNIDIVEADNRSNTLREYVAKLVSLLDDRNLLIVN